MLFKRIRRNVEPITEQTISIRAYELWQSRGCPENSGHLDWQIAQEQLLAETLRFPRLGRRKPLRRLIARIRNRQAA